MSEPFALHPGDCLDVLRTLLDASVDSIVTDPPYGLSDHKPAEVAACLAAWLAGEPYRPKGKGFMGKQWDAWVPGPEVWRECLRVLKPGGHLLAFAGTRSMDLMSMAVRLAGFELRDSIGYAHDGGGAPLLAWAYGSGFPKSLDVSKALDRAAGAEADREVIGTAAAGTPGGGRMRACNLIDRGDGKTPDGRDFAKASLYVQENKGRGVVPVTAPATEAAQQWEGWGTALKPAWEPIILARKPLAGTVAENVLRFGTGALNIDGCRVETGETLNGGAYAKQGGRAQLAGDDRKGAAAGMFQSGKTARSDFVQPAGRFPANLIHDGGPEVVGLFPESTSGAWPAKRGKGGISTSGHSGQETGVRIEGTSGSAARFFYCAKASRRDRNEGLADPGPQFQHGATLRKVENTDTRGNNHPTVKPTDLMRYLCRLVTPPGGTVLDPYMGSGSTGKAAILEGFRFIGIERDPDFLSIARARIEHAQGQARPEAEEDERQLRLFA